jgi:hypothetical protein
MLIDSDWMLDWMMFSDVALSSRSGCVESGVGKAQLKYKSSLQTLAGFCGTGPGQGLETLNALG